MCGIAGIVDLEGGRLDGSMLVRMNTAIRHRGLDDEGYVLISPPTGEHICLCGEDSPMEVKARYPQRSDTGTGPSYNIGLAHRRFSIIDLTSGGHQPFFSGDGSCCLVYNGELYNYIELRQELMREGCLFRTESDTEVLIEAYRLWGTDCFYRLNGFWAAAIYDFRCRRLVLTRDRLGKKPLYWTRQGPRIYFASEIKALLAVPEIAHCKKVNERAAYLWLAHGLRDGDDTTLFEGIHNMPPASWVVVDTQFPQNAGRYWRVPTRRMSEKEVGVDEAARSIRDILQDAIRIRLRADVPWAIELSGGMDSSALVALGAPLHSGPLRTYTVRFPDRKWDEESFARSVAGRYGADYRIVDSPFQRFWAEILAFTHLQEEPYHSPNLQTNQRTWTLMRSEDTKVSLNGLGGDELFAGYRGYFHKAQTEAWRSRRGRDFVRNAALWTESRWVGEGWIRSLGSTVCASAVGGVALRMRRPVISRDFIKLGPMAGPVPVQSLAEVLYRDMTCTRMPYWLRCGDKSAMGIPLEIRAPFLDYRLVDHVFQLPSSFLIRDGWHKWILRQSLKGLLPDDVLWRKRKLGFPFPIDRFCRESEAILSRILADSQNPYLDCSRSSAIRQDWRAISFVLWYELFFNENLPLFHAIADLAGPRHRRMEDGYVPCFLHSEVARR